MQEIFIAHKKTSQKLRLGTIRDRKEKLQRLLNWIYTNRDLITKAIYEDLGKPVVEVELTEILPVTTEIKMAINNLNSWARNKKVPTSLINLGTQSYIKYEPKGTNLIIAPWNYPFNLTLSPLLSAIAAGNTAIIKPSGRVEATADLLIKLTTDLFDQDEIKVVKGGIKETQELLKLPFDHIFFTGSPKVGKIVMEAASKNLTSVTLELGGKSPAIVDSTANIKDAARKLSWGKFTNCGQTCIAPDYILVHESKFEALKTEIIRSTNKLYDNEKKGIINSDDYSRIIDEHHIDHLDGLVDQATSNGAILAMGGESEREKNYYPPTMLSDVNFDAKLMQDEIFGPVLPIHQFSNLDEALDIINERPKPLALYLFTRSKKNQQRVINETSSGGVNINDNLIQFANNNLPFGGINNSGLGNSHGYHGFLAFSNEKAIMKQRVGRTLVSIFYPPYSKFLERIVKLVVRYF